MTTPLNQLIYQHGLPESSVHFPGFINQSGTKAIVPKELLEKPEFLDISQFIPEKFFLNFWMVEY